MVRRQKCDLGNVRGAKTNFRLIYNLSVAASTLGELGIERKRKERCYYLCVPPVITPRIPSRRLFQQSLTMHQKAENGRLIVISAALEGHNAALSQNTSVIG